MKLGNRIITTLAVAFLLAPTLLLGADDTAKPAATTKKEGTAKSQAAPGAALKTKPAAAPQESVSGKSKPHSTDADKYIPRFDLFLGYSNFREASSSGNRLGWLSGGSTSLGINANRYLGFVADFGAYHADSFGPGAPPSGAQVNAYGDVYTFMFGPRVTFRHERVSPFVQALFGGVHASDVTLNGCTGIGCTPLPFANSFTMAAGGGIDINLTHHVALRVIQAEYVLTDFANPYSNAAGSTRQSDMRLSAGIVFRFGGEQYHAAPPPPPPPPSQPPVAACSADKGMIYADSGDVVAVSAQASSPDNSPLNYTWTATGGAVAGSGSNVQWNSTGVPPGSYTVRVRVDDARGGAANCAVGIRVDPRPMRPPTLSCSADHSSIVVGEHAQITATVSNPDNASLTYSWRANGGQIIGSGAAVSFDSSGLAPNRYTVVGRVDDGRGNTADCSVNIDAQAPQASAPIIMELEARLALHSIYFPTAQPTPDHPEGGLTESQQAILTSLAADFKKYLELKPDAHLTLEGHADPRGSVEFNKALTDRRVERSKSFLVEQGVPAASIDTQSLGKEHLLTPAEVRQQMENNPDLTPEERHRLMGADFQGIVLAQNRRVDIVLNMTQQKSVRQYPFNARDAHTLLEDKQLVH